MKIITIFLLFFATNAFAAGNEPEMVKAVNAFYNTYLTVKPLGVPAEKELTKFKPYLSASLMKLLNESAQAEEKYRRVTKGEVPPLVEGDLFTSLFEGATSFKVLSCEAATGSCLVELSYVEAVNGPPTKWKDKAYLVKDSRGWLITDIEYLGEWQFMHKGRLQELLKQVVKEGNEKP